MAVNIPLISTWDAKGVQAAQRELDNFAKHTQTTTQKISKFGKVGFASLSTFVGGVGAFAVDQTSKLEDANAQLENAFKNTGTSVEEQKNKLAAAQAQLERYGYSNADSAEAIARLTTVTGSADKALGSISLAADIAKNRHVDLTKAGDMLAKTLAGNTSAAKRMGVAIPESVNKIKDPAQKSAAIMKILQDRFKGSADAAAGTFKGKMEAAKAQLGDLAAKIGSKLIPAVMGLVSALMKIANWVMKHKEVMIGVLTAIGLALIAMAGMWLINTIAAMEFWVAATGGIIILIGALAAGIAWIVMHWSEVWGFIKHTAVAAWHWIYKNVVGPIKDGFVEAWHGVLAAFRAIWDWLNTAWSVLTDVIFAPFKMAIWLVKAEWHGLVKLFKGAMSVIGSIFSSIGNAIWDGIKWGLNKVIDGLNVLIRGFNKVSGWVTFGTVPKIPEIPGLAKGGPVSAMSPYIVGEQGPELFVPSSSGSIVPNHAFGGNVVQHITIVNNDPQAVVNALIKYQQRNGSVPIKTVA